MKLIDLHTHSLASDGTDSPEDLVSKAHAAGLAAVALTDHDTLAGLAAAEARGRELGMTVVRGCEISATTAYGEMHILGLWIPEKAPALDALLAKMRERRDQRNRAMLARLADLGMPISLEELQAPGGKSVGRPHMAAAMVARGYVRHVRQAFEDYLGRNGKAWLPRETVSPVEAVHTLAQLGATPCLAHPMLLRCPRSWLEAQIAALAGEGLDAIEIWHSEHSEADVRCCAAWARRYALGQSGGSDYHGAHKPGVALGVGRGGLRVPLGVLEALRARRAARGLPC